MDSIPLNTFGTFVFEDNEIHNFNEFDFIRDNFSGVHSWIDRIDYLNNSNNSNYHNDISMIKYAGLGVAMQNTDCTVKRAAELAASASNDDDNVLAELLEILFNPYSFKQVISC